MRKGRYRDTQLVPGHTDKIHSRYMNLGVLALEPGLLATAQTEPQNGRAGHCKKGNLITQY